MCAAARALPTEATNTGPRGVRFEPFRSAEQAWFWTREWQAREREADDDPAAGRVTRYESDEEFLAALDERTKPLDVDA